MTATEIGGLDFGPGSETPIAIRCLNPHCGSIAVVLRLDELPEGWRSKKLVSGFGTLDTWLCPDETGMPGQLLPGGLL